MPSARLVLEQCPVGKGQAAEIDDLLGQKIVLVIRVGARLTDARVEIGMRQIEDEVAADLEQAPPFAQCAVPVLDMLEQMTGKIASADATLKIGRWPALGTTRSGFMTVPNSAESLHESMPIRCGQTLALPQPSRRRPPRAR